MITNFWAADALLPGGAATRVRFRVTGDRFTAVETSTDPEPTDVRLPGVMLPGLANAHSHAFHRALRGRTHGNGGTFWTWREQMYTVAGRLDPDSYLALARATYAEMALAGITTVGEFHYLHHGPGQTPYADPNAMGLALVEAAAQAGIRLTLLDVCYLAGGLTAAGHQPLDPIQRRFSDGSVEGWATRVGALAEALGDDPAVRIGAAAHSVRAVPAADLTLLAGLRDPGRPLHVHLSEQTAENIATQVYYGCSPTASARPAGCWTPAARCAWGQTSTW